ncbi:MAG: glycosyltransferase [Nitrospira sp.]|nr:glycosyltransferase [Nitrospira sp.]
MHKPKRQSARVKVCHVAMGDLWAGAEVQLLSLMTHLVRSNEFEWSIILFNEGRLAEELRKLPLSVSVIPETHHAPIAIANRLAKTFRHIGPDIVHTHKYKDSILGATVARYVGVPHIVRVVHGMPEPFSGLRNLRMLLYTMVDRFVTRRLIDRVVAVSSDIEKQLIQIYGANHVVRIHNGIDLEAVQVSTPRTQKRREWRVDDKVILIGTVGRLVPVKGHAVLLEALRVLRESNRNVMLLVVGDGPLRGQLESEVARLGLGEAVIFAGHHSPAYDFINMMDVFVLPSLHEGIPMVLLEALALQRPVVATRVGGIPEVIAHGETGLLAEPADALSLARFIQQLIEDQAMAVRIGKAGRTRVEEEFNAQIMAEKTVGLYEKVLGNVVPSSNPVN